jgi:hypothetical protein
MKQHYFDVPFAFAGDVTAIPDPLQVGGSVSMTEGWNFNYQRDLSTDPTALPIDRSTTNWLLLQISTALQALQQAGVPEFILASQNGGTPFSYGLGSVVLWSASGNAPFGKYVSLIAANTNTPSVSDPQGLTTGWQIEVDPIATAAQAAAGTNDASIMTPLKVAQQTALRALLAGNSSQVFNVAPATVATHAPQYSQLTGVVGISRGVTATQTAAAATLAVTAVEIEVASVIIGGLKATVTNLNVTFNGATTGANGMDTGTIPASGFLAIYAIYNPTTQTAAVLGVNATPGILNETYTGANMPAGFTMSALMFVVPTTAANLIGICMVRGRRTLVVQTPMFSVTATQASPVIANNVGVPLNAKRCSGFIQIGNSGTGSTSMALFANSSGVGGKTLASSLNASSVAAVFEDLEISTPQRVFYTATNSGGSPTFSASMSSWEI